MEDGRLFRWMYDGFVALADSITLVSGCISVELEKYGVSYEVSAV